MDELDLASVRIPEGFFLDRQTLQAPFLAATDPDEPYQHCFTYRDSDTSIRTAAVDLIRSARRKVFVASFRIGDAEILRALLDAGQRLRGGVYVITSWTENSLRRDLAQIEDLDDMDVAAQHKKFDQLTRRGIALRGHEQCHAKFLVVDDERALVSSANLETSALVDQPGKRLATGEDGVVVTDRAEVNRLARLFARMWYAGCTWEVPPGGEYVLRHRDTTPSPVTVAANDRAPGAIWTDGDEHHILHTLHEIIGLAREELLLATFGLNGIRTRPEMLLEPIRQAMAARSLDMHLLVRARNNIADHRADTAALADLGVHIHADSGTHAKGVIADGRYGALFSANLDAAHGLYNGVEVGTRLDGLPALTEARRYLLHAMDHADRRFAARPTQQELDADLNAAWQRRWNRGPQLRITTTDHAWGVLIEAARTGPVLWEDAEDLRLYAGTYAFALQHREANRYLMAVTPSDAGSGERLRAWYDNRRDGSGGNQPRGFCPVVLRREDG